MSAYTLKPIGTIKNEKGAARIELIETFIPALEALDGFSHIQVIWWFSDFDTEEARSIYAVPKPYVSAPETVGIFATRSPVRPNPLALSTSEILDIDHENGIITLDFIDAHDGSPVFDLKPYTPSADRVENPCVPDWCAHWPKSYEASGDFNWEAEFTF